MQAVVVQQGDQLALGEEQHRDRSVLSQPLFTVASHPGMAHPAPADSEPRNEKTPGYS